MTQQVYLLWSSTFVEISGFRYAADVPDGNGGTKRIRFADIFPRADALKDPDTVVVWAGAKSLVKNIERHELKSENSAVEVGGPITTRNVMLPLRYGR